MGSQGSGQAGAVTAEQLLRIADARHREYKDAPSPVNLPLLDQAVAIYASLLAAFTEPEFPLQWAGIQTNLVTAYTDLPTADRSRSLKQAIGC
jgi:hypothetical protein